MITALTFDEIQDNKNTIIGLLKSVKREGIEGLISYLENSTFFSDPASNVNHGNFQGGLALHSLVVYNNLLDFKKKGFIENDDESIILVALLHDICKAGTYDIKMRNQKNEAGNWIQVPFYAYKSDGNPYGHGEKSVDIIRDYIKLSLEEKLAIRFHMGAYEGDKIWNTLNEAQNMSKLVMYTHFADMLASRYTA